MTFERMRKSLGNTLVSAVVAIAMFASVAGMTYNVVYRNSASQNKESTAQIIGRAISVLSAETSSAADGYPLPPAAASSLNDGYTIPTSSAAPRVDAYGASLLYCPWDNGASNASAGRLTGDTPGSDDSKVIAVISSGMNKRLETSCTNAKAGLSSGDDVLRVVTVSQLRAFGGMKFYLPPVDCENTATPTTDLAGNAANCGQSRSRLDLVSTASISDGALITIRKSGKVFQWVSAASQWRQTSGAGGGYAMPDDFSFTPVTGADTSSLVVSNTVALTTVSVAAPISIDSVGQYQINGGAWTNTLGTVNPGDTLAVRLTSSAVFETTVSTIINVAGKTKSFSVTTGSLVIEDVFSVDGYNGNGISQTVTNNIDLAGKGGMVWTKSRSDSRAHSIQDTVRGRTKYLNSSTTDAEGSDGSRITSFNSTGFTVGDGSTVTNSNNASYATWTFRKAPKFFDVVTWSGNNASGRQISHSLGTTPGLIIVKNLDTSQQWPVWHRSLTGGQELFLNQTASTTSYGLFGTPTDSTFTVNSFAGTNASPYNYIAYVIAHDPSATGLIQAGSYIGNGGVNNISLGWEPQFVLVKRATGASDWHLIDTTRGMTVGTGNNNLYANLASAEMINGATSYAQPTATGFSINNTGTAWNNIGDTYIYVAVRRGPMRKPTDATKVFKPVLYTGNTGASSDSITTGFPVDMILSQKRNPFGSYAQNNNRLTDRALGLAPFLNTQSTNTTDSASAFTSFGMTGMTFTNFYTLQVSGIDSNYVHWAFRRHPGVLDTVIYSGGGGDTVKSHNLGVVPEMAISKRLDGTSDWFVSSKYINSFWQAYLKLNSSEAATFGSYALYNPTSTQITASGLVDASGGRYVTYLAASLPGISKIGTYAGSSSDVTVDAGFSGAPRLLLIKRTDSPGNWIIFDSARGITNGGSDPALRLNLANEETNGVNHVEPTGSGFIAKAGNADVNASGGNYFFWAIR